MRLRQIDMRLTSDIHIAGLRAARAAAARVAGTAQEGEEQPNHGSDDDGADLWLALAENGNVAVQYSREISNQYAAVGQWLQTFLIVDASPTVEHLPNNLDH